VFQRRFAPIWGCPLCFGIGVRNGLEWVSENSWNQCPDSSEYTVTEFGFYPYRYIARESVESLLNTKKN
ncbi:MAG: hypothetical protein RAP03_02145, partial [Candidatus Electryonea clarkiae]|nr:hypothetical protein [Candidatus Electryonea clarkiae]